MILYNDGGTEAQMQDSEYILELLNLVYPGHPWGVRVMEGGFFIQYLLVPFNKPYGMACKYSDFSHSASALRLSVIRMAGEWLERAGLARKALDPDQEIEYVEGIPERHQIPQIVLAESIHVQPDDTEGTTLREVAHAVRD